MSNYMNSPLFVKFVNFSMERNFAQEDDEYLDEYADKQSDPKEVKKAIKREKAAQRREKRERFWKTYGDVVKLGVLATAGAGTAVLGGKVLKDKLSPVFKEIGDKMQQKKEAAQELKKQKEDLKQYKKDAETRIEEDRHKAEMNKIARKNIRKESPFILRRIPIIRHFTRWRTVHKPEPNEILSDKEKNSQLSAKELRTLHEAEEKAFKQSAKYKARNFPNKKKKNK